MNEMKKDNVFRGRNFRLVFFGALVSELGALLYNFAVSFYILQISGNSAFLQGLYLALCGAAMLVFTPVGGVLGDRFSKAKIMYLCDYIKGGMIILATSLMLIFPEADAHIVILLVLGILVLCWLKQPKEQRKQKELWLRTGMLLAAAGIVMLMEFALDQKINFLLWMRADLSYIIMAVCCIWMLLTVLPVWRKAWPKAEA